MGKLHNWVEGKATTVKFGLAMVTVLPGAAVGIAREVWSQTKLKYRNEREKRVSR